MYKKILYILLCVFSNTSLASNYYSLIGLSALYSKSPYIGIDTEYKVLPFLLVDEKNFFIRGRSIGYKLPGDTISQNVSLSYDSSVDLSDSNIESITKLNNRKDSTFLNYELRSKTYVGLFSGLIGYDIHGKQGVKGRLRLTLPLILKPFRLFVSVEKVFAGKKYNNERFGVTKEEFDRTGITEFKAVNGGFESISLNYTHGITDNWSINLNSKYNQLDDELSKSPLLEKTYWWTLMGGISYKF